MRAAARLLFVLGVLLAARPAAAVYQCGDQTDDCHCGDYDPYPCCDNGGNCTWWAWEAACCNWAVALPGWGNANQWVGNASADANYDVLAYPVVGAIACKVSGTYGHVAWVTTLSGAGIDVTEENCCTGCNYGMRAYSYSDWHHFDGGFIIRKSQTVCQPGDSQTQGCGQCGTQSRGCDATGNWGAWDACAGEGPCSPNDTSTEACGDCGQATRTCSGSCQWGDYGACVDPDPPGACVPDSGIMDDGGAIADDGGGIAADGSPADRPGAGDGSPDGGGTHGLSAGCGCHGAAPPVRAGLIGLVALFLTFGRLRKRPHQ